MKTLFYVLLRIAIIAIYTCGMIDGDWPCRIWLTALLLTLLYNYE